MTRVTQEHMDARRESILGAAARLFARKGIAGATMAEIANEAGLSAGAIYRYYESKEELSRAVFETANQRQRELFGDAGEGATSPMDALVRLGHRVWTQSADMDDLICDVQMSLAAARDPEDIGVDVTLKQLHVRSELKDLVVQAQAAGEIDPGVDADAMAVILQACTSGIQLMKLVPGDDFDVEAAFHLFATMVRGETSTGAELQGSRGDNGVENTGVHR